MPNLIPAPPRYATRARRLSRVALGLALSLPAAACVTARPAPTVTGSIPHDYHDRHPILLVGAEEALDVYAVTGNGGVGERRSVEVRALAQDWRRRGKGPITALVPVSGHGRGHHGGLAAVRVLLAGAGVDGASLRIATYPVEGPAGDQPIRLSYTKLKAQVATRCGQWPDDLLPLKGARSWDNQPYYNFGCSTQQTLASQVADPLDLVRPRPESRIDTARRIKVIEEQRKGKDPSTEYRGKADQINKVVGGGS